jgi:hypothetical protein
LILVAAERARDFPQKHVPGVNRGPVYLLGVGESVETPMVSRTRHLAKASLSRKSSAAGFKPLALDPRFHTPRPADEAHALALSRGGTKKHLLRRVPHRRPHGLCRGRPHGLCPGRHNPQRCRPPHDPRRPLFAARGKLAHLPIYSLEDLGFVPRGEAGTFIAERNNAPAANSRSTPMAAAFLYAFRHALQESVRQNALHRPRAGPGARISVCHGVGGMFAASGTIIMSNEALGARDSPDTGAAMTRPLRSRQDFKFDRFQGVARSIDVLQTESCENRTYLLHKCQA